MSNSAKHQLGQRRKTYNVQGEVRSVGNVGLAVKVLAILIELGGQLGRLGIDLGALEEVEGLDLELLLEVNLVLAAEAAGLGLGLSLDGHVDSLVVGEPDVELSEGLHVGNLDLLANIDDLVLIGGGGGEVEGGESDTGLDISQVHVADEGVNVGMDGAVGGDG